MKHLRLSIPLIWNRIKSQDYNWWSDTIGLIGLFLFSFGVFYRELLVHEGLLLISLSFVLRLRSFGKDVMKDHLLILSAAYLMFLLIRIFYTATEFTDHQSLIFEAALKSLQMGFLMVFLVAFCMHRASIWWDWLIVTLMVGFLVRILRQLDFDNIPGLFKQMWLGSVRAAFGSTTNRYGLWNAVILLACLLLYRQIWGNAEKKIVYCARKIFWGFMTVVSVLGLAFSQSRSAWLGAILVMPVAIAWKLYRISKLQINAKISITVFLSVSALTALIYHVFDNRILSDIHSYIELLSGDIDINNKIGISNIDSISERLLAYRMFLEKWIERPLAGYGPGISRLLIETASGEYKSISHISHFHNFVFEILIQMGILGLLFFIAFFYLIFRQLMAAVRSGLINLDYMIFVLCGLCILGVGGMFGEPFRDVKGIFLLNFLGAIAYASAFSLHPRVH